MRYYSLVYWSEVHVSQGSVATYARCGWIFNNRFTENVPRNLPVKKMCVNRLRFDRIMATSLWPYFVGPPCTCRPSCKIRPILAYAAHATKLMVTGTTNRSNGAYGRPTCSKQPRRVDRRKCGQQARPSTSFVDNTIDLLWRNFFSKTGVSGKVPEETIGLFIFGDSWISL